MSFIYSSKDNTLTEKASMEKPQNPADILGEGPDILFLQARQKAREYNAHISSLRTIQCDERITG